MGSRHADRLWMYGGSVGALVLFALGWFLAIRPVNAESASLRAQADDTQTQIVMLRKQLAGMESERAKLETYRAALKTNQQALPTDSGVPDFLRQLQASGDTVDVVVSGLSVSPPETDKAVPTVYDLPITVTAEGTPGDLGRFLDQMQREQARAVLIESAHVTGDASDEGDTQTLSVQLRAFVVKGGGAVTATPTPSASTK